MTRIDQTLPAVLRRHSKRIAIGALLSYTEEALARVAASIASAADELEVRRRCSSPEEAEDVAAQAVHECRGLRSRLVRVHVELKRWADIKAQDLAEQIESTLLSVPEAGAGRRVLGIVVGDTETKAALMAKVERLLDNYFEDLAASKLTDPRDLDADEED